MGRFSEISSKYGKVGVASYVCISLGTWVFMTAMVKNGVDMKVFAKYVGVSTESERWQKFETAGPYAAGYILYKVVAPVRIPITLAVIPFICRRFVK